MVQGRHDGAEPGPAVTHTNAPIGPIAIGGVGGSGTRLVAQLLLDANMYLGNDLNESNDNLWFTLLFRRPNWFDVAMRDRNEGEISRSMLIFEKAMRARALGRDELEHAARAAVEVSYQHDPDIPQNGQPLHWTYPWQFSLTRVETLAMASRVDVTRYAGWGWKEPNTHVFLPYLSEHFPGLKYVHVMRNGLDMAYSSNQAQVHNWGHLFGVQAVGERPTASDSLTYWIRANRAAVERGSRLLGDRFLLVQFDALCASPEDEIGRLLRFVGLDPAGVAMHHLASLPRMPASMGRYQAHDLSVFTADQIDAVRAFGFAVE